MRARVLRKGMFTETVGEAIDAGEEMDTFEGETKEFLSGEANDVLLFPGEEPDLVEEIVEPCFGEGSILCFEGARGEVMEDVRNGLIFFPEEFPDLMCVGEEAGKVSDTQVDVREETC